MKFNKKVSCEACSLKCDIYQAMIRTNKRVDSVETLQVYYKRHEIICKQGADATHAIYLVNGTAKLYIEGFNNRNVILYILKPHSYIGLLSFFETPKYSYSVKAIEDSQICMVDLAVVKELYIADHEFLIKLNHAFGLSVQTVMNKIISLNQKQIMGRVAESLLYLSDLYQNDCFIFNLTRKELGEISGISEENTVRILTELKNERIINTRGKEIEIIDRKLLCKISDCC